MRDKTANFDAGQQPGKIIVAERAGGALRTLLGIAALAALYLVAGRISLSFAVHPGYAAPFWPAAGIALAALALYGRRLWPGVLVGSLLVNAPVVLEGLGGSALLYSFGVGASISVGATLQALFGARLIESLLRRDPELVQVSTTLGVLGFGGPASCLVNATWATSTLAVSGLIRPEDVAFSWFTWWVGDSIGVLLMLPLALVVMGQPRKSWRRRFLPVALPLVLSSAAVGFAISVSNSEDKKQLQLEFEHQANLIGDALTGQFARYLEVVHSIQNLFASSDQVTREEFRTFAEYVVERVPGIQAMGWNPRILSHQRAALEESTRDEGFPSFRFTEIGLDGQVLAAGERDEYVVVHYIEPVEGNETAIGLDVYANPARREALDRARDTGEAVATRAITLVQESDTQQGVLVTVPHYSGVHTPLSTEQRRAHLLGFAVGVFRLDDVFMAALSELGIRNIDARLYDETTAEDATLLASYLFDRTGAGARALPGQDQTPIRGISWSHVYSVATRQWRVVITPMPDYFSDRRPWHSWVVLTGGLSLTGILGLLLITITGRQLQTKRQSLKLASINEVLQDEVTQRKETQRALHEEKERLEVTLHSIGDAVIAADAQGMIEFINPVAEQLTGWSNAEAIGRPATTIFRIINEETREAVKDPVARCLEEGKIVGLANHTVLVSRSGREYAIQDSAAPILDRNGQMIGVVLVFNDVTETRRMAREAEHYASHDALTGLVNRREFDRRLEQSLASSKRYGTLHALCYLDLDQFKIVNDSAGHGAGDELLKQLALLITGQVRDRDTVARFGGDEFGLLLDNCPTEKALEIAESLVAAVRDSKFVWADRSFELGVSVGVVPVGGSTQTAEELLSQADVACYAAKDLGRNRVHLYAPEELDGADPRHREIIRAADIKGAVEQDRLMLHCQPILALEGSQNGHPWGYEILVRMLDDDGQVMNPASFIPAAERYGLMHAIDRWVIESTLRDLDTLFPRDPDALISVNLSANSLNEKGALAFLHDLIDRYGVSPERICFEITETAAIRNLTAAREFIKDVQAIGGRFALDDFGSGLSSFGYLKGLQVDYLKIDGRFVRDVAQDPNDRAMVEAINSVAHTLGIQTVAEHAESSECVRVLTEIGIDYAQGFVLGRPRPVSRWESFGGAMPP